MTLAEEMEAFRGKSRANPDPERKAVYARAAESLAGIVLSKLAQPGAPVISGY